MKRRNMCWGGVCVCLYVCVGEGYGRRECVCWGGIRKGVHVLRYGRGVCVRVEVWKRCVWKSGCRGGAGARVSGECLSTAPGRRGETSRAQTAAGEIQKQPPDRLVLGAGAASILLLVRGGAGTGSRGNRRRKVSLAGASRGRAAPELQRALPARLA